MTRSSPRTRAPDERREQLLDAAERVLLERGLTATTVADVAEAAGLAKGTLYLYFESKNEVLAALRARYLSRFIDALAPGAKSTASSTTRLQRFVSGLFEFSIEHQALHHLLFHQAGFSEEDAFAGAREVLDDIINDGVRDGTFDIADIHATSAFVLHGLHGLLIDAAHAKRTAIRPTDIRAATELSNRVMRRSAATAAPLRQVRGKAGTRRQGT